MSLWTISGWLLMASLFTSKARADEYRIKGYEQLQRQPSQMLLDKGRAYLTASGGKQDSALVCYHIVANHYFEGRQNREEMEHSLTAMNNVGYMYTFCYYDYGRAYEYLQRAMDECERIGYRERLPYVYINMGNLLLTEGAIFNQSSGLQCAVAARRATLDCAADMYKKAFHAALDVKDWRMLVIAFNNLSNLVFEEGSIAGDTIGIHSEMHIFSTLTIPDSIPLLCYTREMCDAVGAARQGDYPAALRHIDHAIAYVDVPMAPERSLMLGYYKKSQVLRRMGRHAESLKLLEQVAKMADRYGTRDVQVETYQKLAAAWREQGDTFKADRYQFIYLQKKDSLVNFSHLGNVSRMLFLNELSKKDDEVRLLAHRRQVQNIVTWFIALIALIIIAALLLLVRSYRNLQCSYRQLYINSVETLHKEEKKQKYQGRDFDDAERRRIIATIEEVMQRGGEILEESFTINRLSVLIQANERHVSQVINETYGHNFYVLLANYRVKEACRRLGNIEQYGQLTIDAIAAGVGFKSRSNFVCNFKRVTGLSPSEYLRQARAANSEASRGA